jgi:hypothetical protein
MIDRVLAAKQNSLGNGQSQQASVSRPFDLDPTGERERLRPLVENGIREAIKRDKAGLLFSNRATVI